jgi:hypothetical protein
MMRHRRLSRPSHFNLHSSWQKQLLLVRYSRLTIRIKLLNVQTVSSIVRLNVLVVSVPSLRL